MGMYSANLQVVSYEKSVYVVIVYNTGRSVPADNVPY